MLPETNTAPLPLVASGSSSISTQRTTPLAAPLRRVSSATLNQHFRGPGHSCGGVSPDDQASKAAFRDKFSLNFPILSDLDHQVAEAYGVWGEKQMMGKSFMSTHRVTFLVNPAGQIARVWESVTPTGHAAEVLAEITSQQG